MINRRALLKSRAAISLTFSICPETRNDLKGLYIGTAADVAGDNAD
jgi:hypothetical protein